eukprot:Gb_05101 [translate_table: standard]
MHSPPTFQNVTLAFCESCSTMGRSANIPAGHFSSELCPCQHTPIEYGPSLDCSRGAKRHTGVVVYGKEYYFGGGIQHTPPGQSPYGKPCRVVDLGVTHVQMEIFEDYLQEISPRYTIETYSLLRHNCNNFSSEVAQFLVGCSIPDFILRLPEEVMNSPMGALIMPMILQFEKILKYVAVPQVPRYGASLTTPSFVQNHETSNLSSTVGTEENTETSVKTKVSSNVPPAVEPVTDPVDALANTDAKGIGNCEVGREEHHSNTDVSVSKDPLGDAGAKVQEDITNEFATLMATGSLPASEAAALATRRVTEKHGSTSATTSQG